MATTGVHDGAAAASMSALMSAGGNQAMVALEAQGAAAQAALPWYAYPTAEAPNLRGAPPVRSREAPPNKDIIEDEAELGVQLRLAQATLKKQQDRLPTMIDTRTGLVKDHDYWFAQVYTFVTEAELRFADSKSFFYPTYVMRCVQYFDRLYADNLTAGEDAEAHWKHAFEIADREQANTNAAEAGAHGNPGGIATVAVSHFRAALASLVGAMVAHIRYDLPRAEAWVVDEYRRRTPSACPEDFRPDFMTMTGVFALAGSRMNEVIADRTGVPADLSWKDLQDFGLDALFDVDLLAERAQTWRRTEAFDRDGTTPGNPYRDVPNLVDGRLADDTRPTVVGDKDGQAESMNRLAGDLRPVSGESRDPYADDEAARMYTNVVALPVAERILVLRGLVRGTTGSEDERGILDLVAASVRAGDLVEVLDGADAHEVMKELVPSNYLALRSVLLEHYYADTSTANAAYILIRCADKATGARDEQIMRDVVSARAKVGDLGKVVEFFGGGNLEKGIARLVDELDEGVLMEFAPHLMASDEG